MAKELGTQINIKADASGVEAGVNKAKRSLKDLGATAAAEGKKASDGLAGAGKGADTAAKDVDRATKSLINSIQRTTAALEAGSKSSSDYFKVLANQRGVNADALKPYLTQLDAVIAKQKNVGISAGQTAAAMRSLPAQFTDVATQLAGGQSPFLVLLQQGGQIKDQFGGIRPALSGIASAITPVTAAVGVLAAAFGGLAFAMVSAENAAKSFATIQAQLAATGRAGSLGSNNDIKAFIAQLSEAPGVTREVATQIISELSKVHEIGSALFKDLAGAAADYAKATGKTVPDAAKELAQAFKDPAAGAKQLDQALGTLTSTQLQQIESLTRQNDLIGAQRVLFDALQQSVKGLNVPATELAKATNDLGNAWDSAMRRFDSSEGLRTVNGLLAKTVQYVAYLVNNSDKASINPAVALRNLFSPPDGPSKSPSVSGKVTDPYGADVRAAAATINQVDEDLIKRGKTIADQYKSDARQIAEFRDQQAAIRKSIAEEQKKDGGGNPATLKSLNDGIKGLDQRIEQINKKGAGDAHSTLLAQGKLDIERIQSEAIAATEAIVNQQKVLEARRAANLIDEREYYDEKKRLAQDATDSQVAGLQKENEALAAQSLTKADALNRDRQIEVNRQKIAKLQADQTTNQTVLDIQAAAAIEGKARALDSAARAAERYVQNAGTQDARTLAGMGQGNFQRQIDARRGQRDDQFLARTDVLEAQRRARQITQEEYEKYIQIETDAHEKILEQDRKFWGDYLKVQQNGIKGAQEALANYIYYSQNAFERANQLVSDGLHGLADSLTESIWTGKLDSFKDLGDAIGKQIVKGIVEQQITGPLAQWLQKSLQDPNSGIGSIIGGLTGTQKTGENWLGGLLGTSTSGAGAAGAASAAASTTAMAASATTATASLGALAAAAASAAASLGGSSIAGMAGGGSTDDIGALISLLGYAEGGYTGDGAKYDVAGVVHAGEYVVNKENTQRLGLNFLERLNRRGYADGGFVAPIVGGNLSSPAAAETIRGGDTHNYHFDRNTDRRTPAQVANAVSLRQRQGRRYG